MFMLKKTEITTPLRGSQWQRAEEIASWSLHRAEQTRFEKRSRKGFLDKLGMTEPGARPETGTILCNALFRTE